MASSLISLAHGDLAAFARGHCERSVAFSMADPLGAQYIPGASKAGPFIVVGALRTASGLGESHGYAMMP